MLGMEWLWVCFSWVTHFLGCSSNNKGAIFITGLWDTKKIKNGAER